jgi:hypothetical protein
VLVLVFLVQNRIFTKLEVSESEDGEAWPAVLHVRWQQHGELFNEASENEKPGLSRFDFLLVKSKVKAP